MIVLTIKELDFDGLFVAMADDLCAGLVSVAPSGVAAAVVARLKDWQECFALQPRGPLDLAAQAGLFAELHVLRAVLIPSVGVDASLEAWVGGAQDFQFAGAALEVKSSRRDRLDSVAVSSTTQLETREGGRLMMTAVHLGAGRSDGVSLPELVEILREELPARCRRLFLECLRGQRYHLEDEGRYRGTRYVVRSIRHFEVSDRFPRIRDEDIPAGISGVRYRVNLDAAEAAGCGVAAGDLGSLLGAAK